MPYARIRINKGAICLRLSSFFYTFATDLGTYAHRPVHLQGGAGEHNYRLQTKTNTHFA